MAVSQQCLDIGTIGYPPPYVFDGRTLRIDSPFGESQFPINSVNLGNAAICLLRETVLEAPESKASHRRKKDLQYRQSYYLLAERYNAFLGAYPWYPLPVTHILEKIIRGWTSQKVQPIDDWDEIIMRDYFENIIRYHRHYGLSTKIKIRPQSPLKGVFTFKDVGSIVNTTLQLFKKAYSSPSGEPCQETNDSNINGEDLIEDGWTREDLTKANWRHPGCPFCPSILQTAIWNRVEFHFLSTKIWNDEESSILHEKIWNWAPSLSNRLFRHEISFSEPKHRGDPSDQEAQIQFMYGKLNDEFKKDFSTYRMIHYGSTQESHGIPLGKYIGQYPHRKIDGLKYECWKKLKQIEKRLRQIEIFIENADEDVKRSYLQTDNGTDYFWPWRMIHDGLDLLELNIEGLNGSRKVNQSMQKKQTGSSDIRLNIEHEQYSERYPGLEYSYLEGLCQAHMITERIKLHVNNEWEVSATYGVAGVKGVYSLGVFSGESLTYVPTTPYNVCDKEDLFEEGLGDIQATLWSITSTRQGILQLISEYEVATRNHYKPFIRGSDELTPVLLRSYQGELRILDVVVTILDRALQAESEANAAHEIQNDGEDFGKYHWYNTMRKSDLALDEDDFACLKIAAMANILDSQDRENEIPPQILIGMSNILTKNARTATKIQRAIEAFRKEMESGSEQKGKHVIREDDLNSQESREDQIEVYRQAGFSLVMAARAVQKQVKLREESAKGKSFETSERVLADEQKLAATKKDTADLRKENEELEKKLEAINHSYEKLKEISEAGGLNQGLGNYILAGKTVPERQPSSIVGSKQAHKTNCGGSWSNESSHTMSGEEDTEAVVDNRLETNEVLENSRITQNYDWEPGNQVDVHEKTPNTTWHEDVGEEVEVTGEFNMQMQTFVVEFKAARTSIRGDSSMPNKESDRGSGSSESSHTMMGDEDMGAAADNRAAEAEAELSDSQDNKERNGTDALKLRGSALESD